MASSVKNEKKTGYSGKGFIVAAIALFVIMTMNTLMLIATYFGTQKIFNSTSSEMSLINSSNGQLSSVNEQVLEIISGIGNNEAHINTISGLFSDIERKMDTYEGMGDHDKYSLRRMRHAKAYLKAYNNKIMSYRNDILNISSKEDPVAAASFSEQLPDIYQQEIAPLRAAASEMMVASININSAAAARRTASAIRYLYVVVAVLVAVLIIGEVAIFLVARYTRRSMEEIDRKNSQFAEASSKLMRSREKMEDLATVNILTGMKNRYALESDIGERLAGDQFNIAVFDMDGFRQINDMYGYDFGDEYLSQIAERLKNEYGQYCEIYNITGNEFCAVFNREVSDTQALHYVEGICNAMSSPYTIFNLTVQLTVSASTYHYVAGDCLNVNSLLVKLDNAMRNAKRQGGGQIHQVMNI
jgi:diguanylate cyclase (GGDEF)-like protein